MEPIQSVNPVNVPDGTYNGLYGGWEVEFKDKKLSGVSFRVNHGVRTINLPVKIKVKDGKATVELRPIR